MENQLDERLSALECDYHELAARLVRLEQFVERLQGWGSTIPEPEKSNPPPELQP